MGGPAPQGMTVLAMRATGDGAVTVDHAATAPGVPLIDSRERVWPLSTQGPSCMSSDGNPYV